jgi:hypothetical protein
MLKLQNDLGVLKFLFMTLVFSSKKKKKISNKQFKHKTLLKTLKQF